MVKPCRSSPRPSSLSCRTSDSDGPRVVLGGEVGNAAVACAARFRFAPFDSLSWLRADLTNECVSAFDVGWDHVLIRPFKNFSGDISGRFIEIMALDSRGDLAVHPAFAGLLDEVLKQQRTGGYFCATGEIDWQQPIDHPQKGDEPLGSRMMPALWGNARLLCGLVEVMRAFPGNAPIARAACALGDFYLSMLPRFNDPARIAEYTAGGSYAAGYITCWFPAMEGLIKLSTLTGRRQYLDAARELAAFYPRFDCLPIDHAHGMLCNYVALLGIHEATGDAGPLARVEQRWVDLVQGGYINPAGGIPEKCLVKFARDEGCALVDWLRLNLALGRVTGKPCYWAMAERVLHNHFLQNQTSLGGFGHRRLFCDEEGVYGFGAAIEESTWCCTFHGELGFINVRHHLLDRTPDRLTCNLALAFRAEDAIGTTTSLLRAGLQPGEVLRQRISLAGQPATQVRVRLPHGVDGITAVDATGTALPLQDGEGWSETVAPVTEVEFIYAGGIYAEDRHCNRLPDGPPSGQPFVLGYGSKLIATAGHTVTAPAWPVTLEALRAQGMEPFSAAHRRMNCCFVVGRPVGCRGQT